MLWWNIILTLLLMYLCVTVSELQEKQQFLAQMVQKMFARDAQREGEKIIKREGPFLPPQPPKDPYA